MGVRARDRGVRDRSRPPVGDRVRDRRRGDRDLAGHRDPARADRTARHRGQLLVDPRRRPRRTVLGDLRGSRHRVRCRGRARGRRGPLPGDLEPRVHAGGGRRPHERRRRAARQEHRHRLQPRACRRGAAGRRQRLRDRPDAPAPGGSRVAVGDPARDRRAVGRLAQGDRRAWAGDDLPDRRRRPAVQRRARLRAAPDAPAGREPRSPPRDRGRGHAAAGRQDRGRVRRGLPRARREPGVRRAGGDLRGGAVLGHPAPGDGRVRDRGREGVRTAVR